jgi:hypothetical protein
MAKALGNKLFTKSRVLQLGVMSLSAALASTAVAKVSEQEAAKLGAELTAVGAEKKGNAAGTIPAFDGSLKAMSGKISGNFHDAYADEKPLFSITKDNLDKYKDNLSEGQLALFERFPQSFSMPIYPSHRGGAYNDKIEARAKWNATHTELVSGVDGLRNFTGGVPFPIPKDGAEVMWNARVISPIPASDVEMDDVAVFQNGQTSLRRQRIISEYPYAYDTNEVGTVDEAIGIYAGLVHAIILEPTRQKGQMTIVREPLDQITHPREAYVYIPGSRRVRRAPTVGFDTPDGPGGMMTVDDNLGFNGAMKRYDWQLVGKKEIYIPYHADKFDSTDVDYKTLLPPGHANPDYMRYELHRVWVVEANLKQGERHIYSKRRFYIDEDSWQITMLESYDGRGALWRVGLLNTKYDYQIKGYFARAGVYHDLVKGAYVAVRVINETKGLDHTVEVQGDGYYTPGSLRKMGNR